VYAAQHFGARAIAALDAVPERANAAGVIGLHRSVMLFSFKNCFEFIPIGVAKIRGRN
jgi:hypothetical protein